MYLGFLMKSIVRTLSVGSSLSLGVRSQRLGYLLDLRSRGGRAILDRRWRECRLLTDVFRPLVTASPVAHRQAGHVTFAPLPLEQSCCRSDERGRRRVGARATGGRAEAAAREALIDG